MNDVQIKPDAAPLLRTLSPALRGLERSLRVWFDGKHPYPLGTITRATLEGLAADLHRQADALELDRPLLIVMLMGGTGVGKSTLLNALAGGSIAQASFTRPTTRDPVVYYHESVKPDRLDPALRHCRLAPHDRPTLEQKIIVDTPDLDSNDLANRDKLLRLLPVADVVLYVGSQEKYHDRLGWELFLQQRKRRAFAFVLNKWDRCTHASATGVRPDEDLVRDLQSEGFQNPLLFRTCAQLWVDQAGTNGAADGKAERPPGLPDGEQFADLLNWLEAGISRLEIEAIKARGVSQMLAHLQQALAAACPPDLTEVAERTRVAWEKDLAQEAATTAEVLIGTLDPYQREIEHHFALEGQRRFRGIMAWYLQLFTRAKYFGSTLRSHIPLLPRSREAVDAQPAWDLLTFTRACSEAAASRMLDARGKALSNRLLVEADRQGFPLDVLTDPVESASRVDWRQRHALTLGEVLQQVEHEWSRPKGVKRWVQGTIVFLADWVPLVALLAALVFVLVRYFNLWGGEATPHLMDFLLPAVVLLAVLVVLHLLIALLLPLRWPAIRGEFEKRLAERLREELAATFAPLPGEVAEALRLERKQVEKIIGETKDVAGWLQQREQAASITSLYGS
jgi:energy-coupling factor transporter ATP-binding protein EcfA2